MEVRNDQIVISVLVDRLDEVRKEVAKLAKKANKVGKDPITVQLGERTTGTRHLDMWDGTSKPVEVEFVELIITGAMPTVSGYEFVSRLDYVNTTDGLEVVVNNVPGHQTPFEFRDMPDTYCDHCKTNRFRSNTFIVKGEDGIHLQVGRSCLQDFICEDPTRIFGKFNFLQQISVIDEDTFGLRRSIPMWSVNDILAATNVIVRLDGWMSKTNASNLSNDDTIVESTADKVMEFFAPTDKNNREFKARIREAAERFGDYWKVAADVIEYIKSDDFYGTSDYVLNLKTLIKLPYVERNQTGIVISAVAAYYRHIEKMKQREIESKEVVTSEFVGQEKERLALNLCVLSARGLESGAILIKFADKRGNRFSWFCTSDIGLKVGESYNVKGTVKRHNEYKGVKETLLTRVQEA